jgi:hypothetical protein
MTLHGGAIINLGGPGGGGTWGSITGTLSAQTDLQTALDGKQPIDADLTAIAALATTAYGRSFLPLADAAAGRTLLELTTKAQFDTALTDGNFLYVGDITQYTDEFAQDAVGAMTGASLVYTDATPLFARAALTGAITAAEDSNTTALGSFTLAQLNTALSDADLSAGGGISLGLALAVKHSYLAL